MLKFDIQESSYKIFRNNFTHAMVEKLKFFQGIDAPLGTRVRPLFITVEGEKGKIIGGACLLKKDLHSLQGDIADLIATLTSPHKQVWECSAVYFDALPQYASWDAENLHLLMQNFYRTLYDGLVAFGLKKNAHFIVMKLLNETYSETRTIGLWPYVIELKPTSSSDGLFHGVLPLIGRQYESYKKIWPQ